MECGGSDAALDGHAKEHSIRGLPQFLGIRVRHPKRRRCRRTPKYALGPPENVGNDKPLRDVPANPRYPGGSDYRALDLAFRGDLK
jgi:hypothetical protein